MADSDAKLTTSLLHVRPASLEAGRTIDAQLASLALEFDVCGDVYRALARLCAQPAGPTQTVILCVDNLTTPEFEFFNLAKKTRQGLNIYVYGNDKYGRRLIQAAESGADGQVTAETLPGIAGEVEADAATPQPAPRPETETERADPADPELIRGDSIHIQATRPETPAQFSDSATSVERGHEVEPRDEDQPGDDDRPGDDDEDLHPEPARVPWLRRHDAPIRIAPSSPDHDRDEAEDDHGSAQADRAEPLLTEAEMRALMGDDQSAEDIGPDGRDATPGQEAAP